MKAILMRVQWHVSFLPTHHRLSPFHMTTVVALAGAPPLQPSSTSKPGCLFLLLKNHHRRRPHFSIPPLKPCSIRLPTRPRPRPRPRPNPALGSDVPNPLHPDHQHDDEGLKQWDSLTAKFAGAANVPFLLLQLPQIVLNARNLLAGNKAALFAVPWLGMFTGLLGNLSLLSYFAKKGEREAMVVQTLGVVSTYAVIAQLAMAGSMPVPQFTATSAVVACGLLINFLNYFNLLNENIWNFWEDFITVAGLSALPQVMWSTFVPYVPNSILPGIMSFVIAVVMVVMARIGKLAENVNKFVGSISGWTATLLFMWMPVAQMWTNFLNPENIRGLSSFSMLLAMTGNGLLIPRALFVKDLMWFTGSCWASFFYGWGNLICMYLCASISKEFFSAATVGLFLWTGFALWSDSKAYGHGSLLTSLKGLFLGS
ncbi:putative maltose excess protein [Helianthus annuus]|nr:putative maltose excess protein [Helianthus annuus]